MLYSRTTRMTTAGVKGLIAVRAGKRYLWRASDKVQCKLGWYWLCRKALHLCTWQPSTDTWEPHDCCSREVQTRTSRVETGWRHYT